MRRTREEECERIVRLIWSRAVGQRKTARTLLSIHELIDAADKSTFSRWRRGAIVSVGGPGVSVFAVASFEFPGRTRHCLAGSVT